MSKKIIKNSFEEQSDLVSDTITKKKIKRPKKFKVILHNDDYTTMEFVISILINIFKKTPVEASNIMMEVHEKGSSVCGRYSFEIAETKVAKVKRESIKNGHPLKCSLEEE